MEDDFDKLLAELAPLAKAMTPAEGGDDKIKAAAEEAGATMPAGEGNEGGEGAAPPAGGEESDETLGKSFAVTMPDGTVQDAFDATDLIKSLDLRLVDAETAAATHGTALEQTEAKLAKALEATSLLVGMVKSQHARAEAQDTLIKSLQTDITRIGTQPAGRKAVVSLLDKPGSAPTVSAPNPNEIMAKAMTVQASGGLMAADIARLEAHLNNGLPAPADIVARLPA